MEAHLKAVLAQQLHVTWRLAEDVLCDLRTDECLWMPHPDSWTVRPDRNGRLLGDWQDPEPEDVPPPTLAWHLWHAIWWWSTVLDHADGAGALRREDVVWPGASESLPTLRRLHDRWVAFVAGLEDADLESARLTRWPYRDERPFGHVVAWVNIELMKNVAEMSLLRRMAVHQGGLPARSTSS